MPDCADLIRCNEMENDSFAAGSSVGVEMVKDGFEGFATTATLNFATQAAINIYL